MSILIILSSQETSARIDWASRLAGFARAYAHFKAEGVDVTLASPEGGWPWPGLTTRSPEVSDSLECFAQGSAAREELADTIMLNQVCVEDFEGAYCVGCPGPVWQSTKAGSAEGVLAQFLMSGKPVAVIPGNLDLAPHGSAEGLLITGETPEAALLAAQTLLGATRARASGL